MNEGLDSCIIQTIDIDKNSNVQSDTNIAVLQTLGISILIITIVSYIKYHADKRNDKQEYLKFFIELPIDIGAVFISLFLSYYFLVNNINWIFIFVLAEVFAILLGSTIRNTLMENIINTDSQFDISKYFWQLSLSIVIIVLPAIVSIILMLKCLL